MDINRLIKSIKMDVGIILDALPNKDSTEYIMDVLDVKTLPSFDIVYPYITKKIIHREALIEIPTPENNNEMIFRIPSKLVDNIGIMSIRHIKPLATSNTAICNGWANNCGGYGIGTNKFGRTSMNPLYEASWMTNIGYAESQLAGLFTESMTFYFDEPNIVRINKKYNHVEMFEFEFCLKNDCSLMNIPDTVYEYFKKLLLLDVQTTIYNQYKLFENIELPVGNLNLMISEWSGLEDKRDELFREMKNKSTFRNGRLIAG